MYDKDLLENTLKDFAVSIQKKYTEEPGIGVISGISGMALFYFYYARYLNSDTQAEIGSEIISECISRLNNGYAYPTYCMGIAGFGWCLHHLEKNNFIDVDCDFMLSPFDDFLFGQNQLDFKNSYFDILHGFLGYGLYFLTRFTETNQPQLRIKYKNYINTIIDQLDELSIKENDGIKWICNIPQAGKLITGYNTGLAHGISSILYFLSLVCRETIFKKKALPLLKGAVNYFLKYFHLDENNVSCFPNWIHDSEVPDYTNRIAWCYGDLGISLALLSVSRVPEFGEVKRTAMATIENSIRFTDSDDTKIIDSGLCHGSFGSALIYKKISEYEKHKKLLKASEYWLNDGMQKSILDNGSIGFIQHVGRGEWESKYELLTGLSGIGLTILSFLDSTPSKWSECIML